MNLHNSFPVAIKPESILKKFQLGRKIIYNAFSSEEENLFLKEFNQKVDLAEKSSGAKSYLQNQMIRMPNIFDIYSFRALTTESPLLLYIALNNDTGSYLKYLDDLKELKKSKEKDIFVYVSKADSDSNYFQLQALKDKNQYLEFQKKYPFVFKNSYSKVAKRVNYYQSRIQTLKLICAYKLSKWFKIN